MIAKGRALTSLILPFIIASNLFYYPIDGVDTATNSVKNYAKRLLLNNINQRPSKSVNTMKSLSFYVHSFRHKILEVLNHQIAQDTLEGLLYLLRGQLYNHLQGLLMKRI